MDKNFITDEFINMIRDIVKQENKSVRANTEFVYDGVVADDGTIDVKGTKYSQDEIKNYSGNELKSGSIVRIYAKGDKMNNAYVGIVFDNNNNDKKA